MGAPVQFRITTSDVVIDGRGFIELEPVDVDPAELICDWLDQIPAEALDQAMLVGDAATAPSVAALEWLKAQARA